MPTMRPPGRVLEDRPAIAPDEHGTAEQGLRRPSIEPLPNHLGIHPADANQGCAAQLQIVGSGVPLPACGSNETWTWSKWFSVMLPRSSIGSQPSP